jgi:hypothetical protein
LVVLLVILLVLLVVLLIVLLVVIVVVIIVIVVNHLESLPLLTIIAYLKTTLIMQKKYINGEKYAQNKMGV